MSAFLTSFYRPDALERGSSSSALLLLEDIDLVPILHATGFGSVLLLEAPAVESEADCLFSEAELLTVGVHEFPEGGRFLNPELHLPALVHNGQVDVLVISSPGGIHLGLRVYSFGFDVLHYDSSFEFEFYLETLIIYNKEE